MKQALSILLVFVMLFAFVACGNTQNQTASASTGSTGQTATTGSTENITETTTENTTENTAELPTNGAPVVEPSADETPIVEAPVVQTPVVETPVVETPVVQTPVNNTPAVTPDSTATPPAVSIVKPVTNAVHNALPESEYYQYANMNAQDKALYTAILSGLKGMQNFIDVQKFGVDYNTPPVILKRVLADHPELFYVIGNTITTYQDSDRKAINLVVRYTDGTDIDVISDDCKNVIRTANI